MRVDFLLVLLLIGTTPFSAPSIFIEGDTDTANASGVGRMDNKWHTLWGVPVICAATGLLLTMLFCMIDARTTFPNISAEFVLRSAIALPFSPDVDALIDDEWIHGQLTLG